MGAKLGRTVFSQEVVRFHHPNPRVWCSHVESPLFLFASFFSPTSLDFEEDMSMSHAESGTDGDGSAGFSRRGAISALGSHTPSASRSRPKTPRSVASTGTASARIPSRIIVAVVEGRK